MAQMDFGILPSLQTLHFSAPLQKFTTIQSTKPPHFQTWAGSDTAIDKLYPDRQYISSSQQNWTFYCPVLGSRHCTCAYTETVDPARRPSIPQVRQGSVRFNLKEEEPPSPPFPSCCSYSMDAAIQNKKEIIVLQQQSWAVFVSLSLLISLWV